MTEVPSPFTPGEPKQAQIVRLIRTSIEAGSLRDGEVLPSTRELAQRWGVSVYTINEAMQTLGEQGFVENVSRSKRVARDPSPHSRRARVDRLKPTAIFVGGYAGCGKTEFGRILARHTGWPILDKDTTTRPVVEFALEALGIPSYDRESEEYLAGIRPREYEALKATVMENIECGVSVIATAPFIREFGDQQWLGRIWKMIQSRGGQVVFAWIRCDTETMHTYVRQRGAARDAGKLANWKTYAASIDPEFEPPTAHVIINNGVNAESLQAQAEELVKSLSDAVRQEVGPQ